MRLGSITSIVFKITIYVYNVQKTFAYFFVDWLMDYSVLKLWTCFLTDTDFFLSWIFLQSDLIHGLEVKSMRISIFNDHNNGIFFSFQPIRFEYVSFDTKFWNCGLLVKIVGFLFWWILSCMLLFQCYWHWLPHCSHCASFNFCFFFHDTLYKNTLYRDKCSTWTFYSDNMSLYQKILFRCFQFLNQAIALPGDVDLFDWFSQTTCSPLRRWVFFELAFPVTICCC